MKGLTHEKFIERVEVMHNKEIIVLGKYKNKRTKILVKHICGYIWEANPDTLQRGHGCPKCANNIKKSTEDFKKEVFKLVGDDYIVLGNYINNHTPILIKHNFCKQEFYMTPKAFLYQNQRCPYERYLKSSKSNSAPYSEIKEKIYDVGNKQYEIIGQYKCASKKAMFIHHKCGNTFLMSPSKFINQGIRCPYCYRSKGEEVIREYLKCKKYKFKEQYRLKECKNIRLLPFDFAIFDNDSLICLIEYDGIQHFKPKFNNNKTEFNKIKQNDNIKTNFCKSNDIYLIRIKYVRSESPNTFKNKIIKELENKLMSLNMATPS